MLPIFTVNSMPLDGVHQRMYMPSGMYLKNDAALAMRRQLREEGSPFIFKKSMESEYFVYNYENVSVDEIRASVAAFVDNAPPYFELGWPGMRSRRNFPRVNTPGGRRIEL
jgi:hypothetical protein